MNIVQHDVTSFMADHFRSFEPTAYFDKHMDCIRVQIQDESVTEKRLSEYFTVSVANFGIKKGAHVGFTIKGVAYLFQELGMELKGVYGLTDILDRIVKEMPHATVKFVQNEFSVTAKDLHVDFDEQDMRAA